MRYSIQDYRESWKHLGLLDKPHNPLDKAQEYESLVFGDRDGDGLRYWIPSLYLLAGRIKDAARSIERHHKTNPDEYRQSSPIFLLAKLYVHLLQDDDVTAQSETAKIVRLLYTSNPFVIEVLLNITIKNKEISFFSNHTHYEYAASFPSWLYDILDIDKKRVLMDIYASPFNQAFIDGYLTFRDELNNLRPGPKRQQVLSEEQYFLDLMTK